MALWDDFVNNIRRSVDQINPWDGGRNWNTLDAEKKKKDEEERRRQQQAATTPRVQTTAPAPNFNTTTPAQPTVAPVNFEKPKQNFSDPTAPLNTSTPKRTFGNNSGATPGQIQMPEELKTPQQKAQEQVLATRQSKLNKDGTVIDTRPFPARVPTSEFSQANEALKQGATIQDVGNYWKSDADALRAELMKPNPDKARVQGLTQSINNRKAEITKMSTMMSKDEQDEFAKKAMESRGGKFQSNQNKVGDFLGAVVAAPFGIFTKPAGNIAYMTNQSSFDTGLEDIDRRYRAGEITRARMEQEFKDLTGGMITPKHNGKAIKVTDQGLDYMSDGEEFAHFVGSVVQQGVDSYVGGGTGVKTAITGGKEVAQLGIKEIMKDAVKQGLKESAVTGSLQTGADVLKGDGITPESLLMNYGVDAVLNTGGEATGKAVKKWVTDAKVKDATDTMNQALRANGTLDTLTETEVRQMMEKEATEQINTATKQVNEKRAATQAQQTPPDVLKPQDEQIPNSLETNVTEPPTKPRSTQSIADLLPGLVGRDPNATKPQFTPADFGVSDATYNRLKNQYGETAAQNILNRSRDATNIRSMDAFVTSEAKKAYGAPKPNDQINAEIQQKQAAREEFNMTQGTPAPDEVVAVNGQMVNTRTGEIVDDAPVPTVVQLSKNATNSLENDTTGIKPNGVERSGGFVENGTAKPVEVRTLEDGSQVIVDGRHTLEYARQNGIDDYPIVDVTDQYRQANVDTIPDADTQVPETPDIEYPTTPQRIREPLETDAELGKIMETFYDSKKGNQKIRYAEMKAAAETVAARAYNAFQEIGSDLRKVAQITQEHVDRGIRNVDEMTGLTPAEIDLWKAVQSEQDYMRRRASLGNKEIGGDQGDSYWHRVSPDNQPTRETLFEGFLDKKPGSEMKRRTDEFSLKADEISYSPQVLSKYIIEHGDTKLLQEERLYRALQRDYPYLPEEQIRAAAREEIRVQDLVNRQKVKIGASGFGKKVTVTDGKVIDVVDEFNKVGDKLGLPKTVVDGTPRGLTNGARINSVSIDVGGRMETIADVTGINQLRDSTAYAYTNTRQARGDREALANTVENRLRTAYRNMSDNDIAYAVESVRRIKAGLDDNIVAGRIEGIYRNAAKNQMIKSLHTLNITNKTLKKDISDLAKQILREGTTERELSAKVVQNTLRAQNALFRKLNLSSAINELSDLTSFYNIYGKDTKIFSPDFQLVKDLGLGEIDPSLELYLKQINEGVPVNKVLKTLKKLNNGTRFYRFVETYKAGVLAKTAKEFYSNPKNGGLTGDQLTARILQDYRDFALPVDMFTKTFLDDYPLYTQYMTWGARNLEKEGKMLTGQFDAGVMKDKSTAQRIARDLYANIPAKTAFWLASNGLKGTTIMTAFGLTDFTGLTQQDYSGIQEEDKSFFDRTTQWTNMSTTLSLFNTLVQALEKEYLKEKYKDADYNPYEHSDFGDSFINTYTPKFWKNASDAQELQDKGYSENRAGRVQYEAPEDAWNIFKSFLFGKNQTANAREYSGRENLVDRVAEGVDPIKAVSDMAKEQLGLQDTDYNRPLSEDYSEKYKSLEEAGRTALLDGGRRYNSLLDDLKKNSPELYNNYVSSMKDHVNPEMWRARSMGKDGKVDLTTFKMIGDRKKQLQKDLGTAYDPVYDLPDDQARSVLQLKSAPTGDDIALRNALGKEGWYKDYKAKVSAYYDTAGEKTDSEFKETQRVKDWNALDDQLQSFYYDKTATEAPAWATQYPLVYEAKGLEYGSDASKAFFRANYDAYAAQKEEYDKAQLGVINQMRKIEGFPEMGWEQYQQATEYADTDGNSKKSGYSYGSGGGNDKPMGVKSASFGQSRAGGYSPVSSVKVKKNPRKARVRSGVKGGKIVVTSKKTL